MPGHVFISYAHAGAPDASYVERLAAQLTSAGIPVWFDREIISGDRWHQVIRDQIDACGAFAVVMTPSSEESAWVNREISRAEHAKRPIFPLLLAGQGFFRLTDVQYEDVRDLAMPGDGFLSRLRRHTEGAAPRHSRAKVRYRVVRARATHTITVTADQDLLDADLAVVLTAGKVMPLSVEDGTVVHRFPRLVLAANASTVFNIPSDTSLGRRYWLRCFVNAPDEITVIDPPVAELRYS